MPSASERERDQFTAAARLLAQAAQPLILVDGLDVDGCRKAVDLASRCGAVLAHARGGPRIRLLEAARRMGSMIMSPTEARRIADGVLRVGAAPGLDGKPELHLADPAALGSLRAVLAGRRLNLPPSEHARFEAMAADLRRWRFGVAVWQIAELAPPQTEMLLGIVHDLNAATRFSGLPLADDGDAEAASLVAAWRTGLPLPLSFAWGPARHDPWEHDPERLIAAGEVDAVLLVSSATADPDWLPGQALRLTCGSGGTGVCAKSGTFRHRPAGGPSAAAMMSAILEALG